MLEIKYLHLENKNKYKKITDVQESKVSYDINLSIDYKTKIGVYSKDKNIVNTFLKLIAGINKPTKESQIKIAKKDVFDNKDYFKNRLYLDFSTHYLNTLNYKKIDEALTEKYALNLNYDKYTKILKDLDIRGECEITDKYEFTPLGNTLVNFALACSLDYEFLIINNPTINVTSTNILTYIMNYLNNNYKSMIFGLNNLDLFIDILDYIIILDDFGLMHILYNNSKLLVINNGQVPEELDKYKLFISFDKKRIILSNELSKDELKELKKKRIDFIQINLQELGGYI